MHAAVRDDCMMTLPVLQVFNYNFNPGIGIEAFGTDILPSASGFLPVSAGKVDQGYPFSISITDCFRADELGSAWVDFRPSTSYFAIFALTDPYAMSVEYTNVGLLVFTTASPGP